MGRAIQKYSMETIHYENVFRATETTAWREALVSDGERGGGQGCWRAEFLWASLKTPMTILKYYM